MAACLSLKVLLLLCMSTSLAESFGRTLVLNKTENGIDLFPDQKHHVQSNVMTVLLPLLYLVAFLVGLPSNLLALGVLVFRTKRQSSTILLINLTACDLLLLLVLPFRIAYYFQGNDWTQSEALCRLVVALFYGNMYGSVFFLALVAFDRYLALVHPIGGRMMRSYRTSVYMSAAAWAVVLLAMAPLLAKQQTYRIDSLNITTCHDALPADVQVEFFVPYFATLFAVCFVVPLLVVVFCYGSILHSLASSGRRYGHAVRVTMLVLTVFLVCLLPSNVLLFTHNSFLLKDGEDGKGNDLYLPYMLTLALSTFNSCLDPFIYYYVSEDFREKAQQVLFCREYKRAMMSSQDTTRSSSSSRSKVTLLSSSVKVSATPGAACRHDDLARVARCRDDVV